MPHKDPVARKAYLKAYHAAHHADQRAKQKAWWEKNRPARLIRLRELAYRRRYGITTEQYEAMLAGQDGRCRICRTDKSYGKGRFHVDHDHATGRVRGVLCHNCNTKLGWFETYAQQVADYLTVAAKDVA